jgi:predicted metal-binding protein
VVNMSIYDVSPDNLRINWKAREWCKLPYPGHPYGCPNYGHKPSCPPQAPLIHNFINISKPMYLVAVDFDLASHMDSMKSLHPAWSDRQAKCVLYWQPRVNKQLRDVARLTVGDSGMVYTTCPEAMGVNVIATAQKVGIPIKTQPTDIVYKIALVGEPAWG